MGWCRLALGRESFFSMCCMKMVARRHTSRQRADITNHRRKPSFFSSAYAEPTEMAFWPQLE